MNDLSPAAIRAVKTLIAIVSAVSLFAGVLNQNVIAGLNYVGVPGEAALMIGGVDWFSTRPGKGEDLSDTVLGTSVLASFVFVVVGFVFLITGGDNVENPREIGVLTFLGGASVLGAVFLASLLTQVRKSGDHKVCPDCANQLLAAARKCQYCVYRFGDSPGTSNTLTAP